MPNRDANGSRNWRKLRGSNKVSSFYRRHRSLNKTMGPHLCDIRLEYIHLRRALSLTGDVVFAVKGFPAPMSGIVSPIVLAGLSNSCAGISVFFGLREYGCPFTHIYEPFLILRGDEKFFLQKDSVSFVSKLSRRTGDCSFVTR